VEFLWMLPDGSVHGLQSKYFLDSMGPSKSSQIDHSVRTALERCPSLSRYTVCLPRDLTSHPRKRRPPPPRKAAPPRVPGTDSVAPK
jgi:hypothetical protein